MTTELNLKLEQVSSIIEKYKEKGIDTHIFSFYSSDPIFGSKESEINVSLNLSIKSDFKRHGYQDCGDFRVTIFFDKKYENALIKLDYMSNRNPVFKTTEKVRTVLDMVDELSKIALYESKEFIALVEKQEKVKELDRITSYNVCYTKLLRLRLNLSGFPSTW